MSLHENYFSYNNFIVNTNLEKELVDISISNFVNNIDSLEEKIESKNSIQIILIHFVKRMIFLINVFFTKKNQIIFYTLDETHLKQMMPVANKLRNNSNFGILFISSKSRFTKEIKKANFEILQIPTAKFSNSFRTNLIRTKKNDFLNSSNFYRNISLKLISSLSPKALIVGNDLIVENRAMVICAKKKLIPSFCIQHGSMNNLNPLYSEIIVDNYFVFGDKIKNHLESLNKPKTRFIVSGAPYLEEYTIKENNNAQNIIIMLSGPGHSYTLKHHHRILKSLISIANHCKEYKFFLKPHSKDFYSEEIINGTNIELISNIQFKSKYASVLDLISEFDVLVSGASTSVLEALFLKKKVVTVDFENAYSEADFIQDGLTVHCKNEIELNRLFENVESIFTKSDEMNKINNYFKRNADGVKSSDIITKKILLCVE